MDWSLLIKSARIEIGEQFPEDFKNFGSQVLTWLMIVTPEITQLDKPLSRACWGQGFSDLFCSLVKEMHLHRLQVQISKDSNCKFAELPCKMQHPHFKSIRTYSPLLKCNAINLTLGPGLSSHLSEKPAGRPVPL